MVLEVLAVENTEHHHINGNSDYHIRINHNEDYVHVVAMGPANSLGTRELFYEISKIYQAGRNNKILCELKLHGLQTFQDLMTLRINILKCDLPPLARMAIISHRNRWIFQQLGIDFFQISGAWTRVFDNVEAARSWLKSDLHLKNRDILYLSQQQPIGY